MNVVRNRIKQFVLALSILIFVLPVFANTNLNYDARWLKVGNTWKVLNIDGTFLNSQWFFDEVQKRWYKIGASQDEVITNNNNTIDSSSLVTGLYTDKTTNKSFYFDVNPGFTFGALAYTNGYYNVNNIKVYLEFNQNPLYGMPEITKGLNELKAALMTKAEIVSPRAGFGGGGGDSDSSSSRSSYQPRVLPKVDKTILVYLIGSDLEEKALYPTRDIQGMIAANIPDDMNVIVFTGGSVMSKVNVARQQIKPNDPLRRLFSINWEINQIWKVTKRGIVPIETNLGKSCMTEKSTFDSFLKYAKQYIPSNEYSLIISDHGGGSVSGFGHDTRYKGRTLFNGGSLLLSDVAESIKSNGFKFEFLGYDACLMSMLEHAYGLSDLANYFIASEELEFGSWDYSFLSLYNDKSKTTLDILKKAVDTYIAESENISTNTLSIVNLNDFKYNIDECLTMFSNDLTNYVINTEDLSSFYTVRKKTAEMGIDDFYDYVDLLDFKNRIVAESSIPDNIKNGISELYDIANEHVEYFKTKKEKNPDGSEKVCAYSLYVPYNRIYFSSDQYDNMLKFSYCMKNTLNPAYREFVAALYARQCLASELREKVFISDDDKVKTELKNKILTRAKDKYKLPDEVITAMETIVDYMSVNRLKAGENANFSLEKSGRANHLLFKYDDALSNFVYSMHTNPYILNKNNEYLYLGQAYIGHQSYTEDGYNCWDIPIENHRWFTLDDELCSFYLDDDEDLDTENQDYLFSGEISGYVPARLIMDNKTSNIKDIVINLQFDQNSDTATIVGYNTYDKDTNTFGKMETEFNDSDKIQLTYNFDNLYPSKKYYGSEDYFIAKDMIFKRGNLSDKCMYQKYIIEDIYGQKYNITGDRTYSFVDKNNETSVKINLPADWVNTTIDTENKTVTSNVETGGHAEEIEFTVNVVMNDKAHFGDEFDGLLKTMPQKTVDYLLTDDIWQGAEAGSFVIKQTAYKTDDCNIPSLNVVAKKQTSEGTQLINKYYFVIYDVNSNNLIDNVYLIESTQTTIDTVLYHTNRVLGAILDTIDPASYRESDPNQIEVRDRPIINTLTGNGLYGSSLENEESDKKNNISTESEIIEETETESEVDTNDEDKETASETESKIEEETEVESEKELVFEEESEKESEEESEIESETNSDINITDETQDSSETKELNEESEKTEAESETTIESGENTK